MTISNTNNKIKAKTIRGLSRQLKNGVVAKLAAGLVPTGYPATKRRYADGRNLYAEVATKTRTRKAVYVWLAKGCTIRDPIGDVAKMNIEEARRRADDLTAAFARGEDPRVARRTAKTVAAAVDDHLAKSSGLRKATTQTKLASSLRRYIAPIAGMDVVKIDADAIEAAFRPVLTEFPVQGRVALQALVKAFTRVGRVDNPARLAADRLKADLTKPRPQEMAAMAAADLAPFWAKLKAVDGAAAACLRFLILTGARHAEARFLRWDEVDLISKTWTLGADRHKAGRKTGKAVRRPLSEAALLEVEALPGREGLVFGKLSEKALPRLVEALGADGVHVHGFRSTMTGVIAKHGCPPHIIDLLLAHRVGDAVLQRYLRIGHAPTDADLTDLMRPWLEVWARGLRVSQRRGASLICDALDSSRLYKV
jgi:integrase